MEYIMITEQEILKIEKYKHKFKKASHNGKNNSR